MIMTKVDLHEVYMEALRLHKLSWQRRIEGKRPWYKKDVFDDSHLPKEILTMDYVEKVHDKLLCFIQPKFRIRDSSGTFGAVLSFNEALSLLLNTLRNIHYVQGEQVDLANYKLMAETFRIEIIE